MSSNGIDRVDHRAELPGGDHTRTKPFLVPPSCRRSPSGSVRWPFCAAPLRPFHRSGKAEFSGTNRPPFASIGAARS